MNLVCSYSIEEVEHKRWIWVSGIDFGYANRKLLIIKETKHFILARKKGTQSWIALSTFGYSQPEYIIFKKKNKKEIVDGLGEWTLEYNRETMKEARRKALEKIDELERIDVITTR